MCDEMWVSHRMRQMPKGIWGGVNWTSNWMPLWKSKKLRVFFQTWLFIEEKKCETGQSLPNMADIWQGMPSKTWIAGVYILLKECPFIHNCSLSILSTAYNRFWYFSHTDGLDGGNFSQKVICRTLTSPICPGEKIPLSSKCRTTFTLYYCPKIHIAHSHT